VTEEGERDSQASSFWEDDRQGTAELQILLGADRCGLGRAYAESV
jgi:hypothetical protein